MLKKIITFMAFSVLSFSTLFGQANLGVQTLAFGASALDTLGGSTASDTLDFYINLPKEDFALSNFQTNADTILGTLYYRVNAGSGTTKFDVDIRFGYDPSGKPNASTTQWNSAVVLVNDNTTETLQQIDVYQPSTYRYVSPFINIRFRAVATHQIAAVHAWFVYPVKDD